MLEVGEGRELVGSEMWGLNATVRSTLRAMGSRRSVLNAAGHNQLHIWKTALQDEV